MRGDVVDVPRPGLRDSNVIERLSELLTPALVRRARVRVQLPFVIDDETEVIPDIAVVARDVSKTEHPSSALLVIEVSDSSTRYDRIVKAPLYAQAGVTEYWLIDANKERVEVFSAPRNGEFVAQTTVTTGTLAVPGFPDVQVPLASLFD